MKNSTNNHANAVANQLSHIHWFRNSAPYINTHRNKTFVIMFGGEAVASAQFSRLVHDFALLHSLGIKLVLVYGARTQIENNLKRAGLTSQICADMRVTPKAIMPYILEAVGAIRLQIEAQLSMGLANSPMYGARIDAVSGNFVTARPFGVRDGVDYQMTGEVRSIDTQAIYHNLMHNHVVILGPTGFSATGEIFNVSAEEVALSTAVGLNADKLIFLSEEEGVYREHKLLSDMIPHEVDRLLQDIDYKSEIHKFLACASKACKAGVHRNHIISYVKDGALLEELFTADGSGTLISHDPYEEIRCANVGDIVGLLQLLKPLEDEGILVKRSQARIEEELQYYSVIERDGVILGCVALYPLDDKSGEVASLAIHPNYRRSNRGADLLMFLEQQARSAGLYELFALTTRTSHWFIEQGFCEVAPDRLPKDRLAKYDPVRNSKVLFKKL